MFTRVTGFGFKEVCHLLISMSQTKSITGLNLHQVVDKYRRIMVALSAFLVLSRYILPEKSFTSNNVPSLVSCKGDAWRILAWLLLFLFDYSRYRYSKRSEFVAGNEFAIVLSLWFFPANCDDGWRFAPFCIKQTQKFGSSLFQTDLTLSTAWRTWCDSPCDQYSDTCAFVGGR